MKTQEDLREKLTAAVEVTLRAIELGFDAADLRFFWAVFLNELFEN